VSVAYTVPGRGRGGYGSVNGFVNAGAGSIEYGAPGLNTATFVQRRNRWRKNLKKFRHIYDPRRGPGRKQTDEFGVLEQFQLFLVKSSPKYTWWA